MMKKILVACGTGMSTSTMIAQKLQDFLAEQLRQPRRNVV